MIVKQLSKDAAGRFRIAPRSLPFMVIIVALLLLQSLQAAEFEAVSFTAWSDEALTSSDARQSLMNARCIGSDWVAICALKAVSVAAVHGASLSRSDLFTENGSNNWLDKITGTAWTGHRHYSGVAVRVGGRRTELLSKTRYREIPLENETSR